MTATLYSDDPLHDRCPRCGKRLAEITEKVKWGFRSKTQLPLFMIWREYWRAGEVEHATVLFNSRDWIGI